MKKPTQNSLFSQQKALSVAEYIELVNSGLKKFEGRVKGEVTELYQRQGYLFFTLKDKNGEGVLSCFVWRSTYKLFGIDLKEGLEIIVSGYPAIYAKSGRLSFQTSTIELVGKGALKEAYEKLKKKLTAEGLFAEEKKRPLPKFPKKIGVVTSRTGAVIHDFTNNLSQCGFKIQLIDARVEGQKAVKDLLGAVKTFRQKDIDVLVVMRGGGSLESLMAFNNELLVREIAGYPVPVIAAIGHEKDKPLVALAADVMVSTPTAAANILSDPWKKARMKIDHLERTIFNVYNQRLFEAENKFSQSIFKIKEEFRNIIQRYRKIENTILNALPQIGSQIKAKTKQTTHSYHLITQRFSSLLKSYHQKISHLENTINLNNPERNLKLGYSITRVKDKIVKSIQDVKMKEELRTQVADGSINSSINKIKKKKDAKEKTT